MAKADWGVKRLCQGCGAKFYDMLCNPITCPSCGNVFDPEVLRARRPRGNTAKAAKPAAVVPKPKTKTLDDDDDTASEEEDQAAAELDDETETDGDSGDDVLLVDTEDLDGDDDKIAAVVVKRDADES